MRIGFLFSKILLGVLMTLFLSGAVARPKLPYLVVSDMDVEEAFEHLQSFLLEKDYFIQSIDSRQRFVQMRFILKPKAWTKLDRRYTVNFFVQVEDEKNSKIRLQINREVLQSTGRANDNWSYYYKDEGMLKADDKLYDELIIALKQYYDSL